MFFMNFCCLDVVELQKAITNDSVDITAQTSDNKSTEELWEIIRYLKSLIYLK